MQKYNKKNGWYVNWASLLQDSEVYALVIKGTVDIQGLVSIQHQTESKSTYIQWMCTAPQNNKELTDNPKYSGVDGHLFAIAGEKSIQAGFEGDVFGFATNIELYNHYVQKLDATEIGILHPFHFGIFAQEMKKIMEVYTYEWTNEEL